jgi:hypothetical protein
MLCRCVVCNGSVEEVQDKEQKNEILHLRRAPENLDQETLAVYQCKGSCQGRWWCEKSISPRFRDQAIQLVEMCIRGGVSIDNDLGIFKFIVDKIRQESDKGEEASLSLNSRLEVIKWLQTERLKNPLSNLRSVYASPGSGAETLQFTNVTSDFVGHLDYILHRNDQLEVVDLLYVPKSYAELNDLGIPNGHLLPSYDWPSDHLAIGCRFAFAKTPCKGDPIGCKSEALVEEDTHSMLGSGATDEEDNSAVVLPPVQAHPSGNKSERLNEEPTQSMIWCGANADEDDSTATTHAIVPPQVQVHPNETLTQNSTQSMLWCGATADKNDSDAARSADLRPPPPPPVQLPKPGHGQRCACGCIPNVLSLFEMAELRKQARLKQTLNGENSLA